MIMNKKGQLLSKDGYLTKYAYSKQGDLSVFTDESIKYLKKISEDISPKQLGKLSYCFT